ncbi:MAG: GntR family transcriptional regulator, partial [Gemmataceae bacterium]
ILKGILSGATGSGTHLNVADIAKELGVSPSPVRDALLRLAAEGLVTNNDNRRATVVRFTPKDVEDIFQVREILEGAAAELAAPRIDQAGLEELKQAAEECAAALSDHPEGRLNFLELDNRFHLLIADTGGNSVLREEIVRTSRRVRVMQWLRLSKQRMTTAYPEHLEVLAALEKGDAAAARAAMVNHIRHSLKYVLEGVLAAEAAHR